MGLVCSHFRSCIVFLWKEQGIWIYRVEFVDSYKGSRAMIMKISTLTTLSQQNYVKTFVAWSSYHDSGLNRYRYFKYSVEDCNQIFGETRMPILNLS
jgi:hypothetical protein